MNVATVARMTWASAACLPIANSTPVLAPFRWSRNSTLAVIVACAFYMRLRIITGLTIVRAGSSARRGRDRCPQLASPVRTCTYLHSAEVAAFLAGAKASEFDDLA